MAQRDPGMRMLINDEEDEEEDDDDDDEDEAEAEAEEGEEGEDEDENQDDDPLDRTWACQGGKGGSLTRKLQGLQ